MALRRKCRHVTFTWNDMASNAVAGRPASNPRLGLCAERRAGRPLAAVGRTHVALRACTFV
jgi:hypothetical protein